VADKPTPPRTRSDLERDIANTRRQLGDTVEALTARLDVKTRIRTKVSAAAAEVQATVKQRPAAVAAIGAGALVALVILFRKARS
jgi:hypothetical protein